MAQLSDTVLYLDFTGLLTYDGLIKEVIAAGDAANSAEITAAIEALDSEGADGSSTGEAIIAISQTDGVISATKGNVGASKVTYSPVSGNTSNTDLQAIVTEIFTALGNIENGAELEVYKDSVAQANKVNTISADGHDYIFQQGASTIATLNIAKDLVVSGGSVITAAAADKVIDDDVIVGEKYIKLTLANSTDVLYIPVNSLYKDHTAAANAAKIQIAISNDNVISANVVAGSIEKTDLTTALQNEITSARTTLTEKSTGHVTLTKTAGTGAISDNYEIVESDIASAALMGTLPNGITATTVTGYIAEAASAAENKATRITVNGQSQNVSTGAITIEGDDIAVKGGSGNVAAAQTNTDIAATDTIDVAVGKLLKKIADNGSDISSLNTFVGNISAISANDIEGLFDIS